MAECPEASQLKDCPFLPKMKECPPLASGCPFFGKVREQMIHQYLRTLLINY